MPLVTRASAADLTSSSVTLQPKRFQLFQPMGGVRAKPFSRARADGTQNRIPKKRDSARQRVFFLNVFMQNLSAYSRFISFRAQRRNCLRSPEERTPRHTIGGTT